MSGNFGCVFYALIESSSSFLGRGDALGMGMLSHFEKFILTESPYTCWISCTCRQSERPLWRWLLQRCSAQQNQTQEKWGQSRLIFFLIEYFWHVFFSFSFTNCTGCTLFFLPGLSSFFFYPNQCVFLLLFLLFTASFLSLFIFLHIN